MKATSYNRAKGNKMKTTLILITIITSLFFSACANNNRAEYWNPRRAANAYNSTQQVAEPNYYVKTIASGIPQRYDRVLGGPFTTTANAMEVIGRTSEQRETARSAIAQLEEMWPTGSSRASRQDSATF
jgi:hypothetical protein